MIRPRLELGTFCVLDRCDNQLRHRTVEDGEDQCGLDRAVSTTERSFGKANIEIRKTPQVTVRVPFMDTVNCLRY